MPRIKLFNPILAGATLQERLIGCAGALLGICVTALVCGYAFGSQESFPLIVAPIGASAVLLFAVPASPLAQPWPIVGGNTISALVGVTVARYVGDPMVAVGLAVGLAIAAMSFTRCLHPPGGAAALTAVVGGPAVAAAGYWFAFVPVAINSVILVVLGLVFHRLARRNYPHRPAPLANPHKTSDVPAAMRVGFNKQDIDAALADFNEALDIDRGDLDRILRAVESKALARAHAELTCADIMSRDVVSVRVDDPPATARRLLLEHDIRTLPVLDAERRLAGTVGLRELAGLSDGASMPTTAPTTSTPDAPAVSLLPSLTDGRSHSVVIVGENGAVVGIVSQTDLLAALASSLSVVHALDEAMIDGRGI